jgi:hypothetical protein
VALRSAVLAIICALLLVACPDTSPIQSAQFLSLPAEVPGEIQPGEIDYFSFLATEGDKIYFSTYSNTSLLLSFIDTDGQTLLAYNSSGGTSVVSIGSGKAQLFQTVPRTGRYFVSVQTLYETDSAHRYVLTVDDGSGDDHGDYPFLATELEPGAEATPGITDRANFEDVDYFSFDVEEEKLYYIEVTPDSDALLTFPVTVFKRGYSGYPSVQSEFPLPAGVTTRIPVMETGDFVYYFHLSAETETQYSVQLVTEYVPFRVIILEPDAEASRCVAATGFFLAASPADFYQLRLIEGQRYRIQTFGGSSTELTVHLPESDELAVQSDENVRGISLNGTVDFVAPVTGDFPFFVHYFQTYTSFVDDEFVVLVEAL